MTLPITRRTALLLAAAAPFARITPANAHGATIGDLHLHHPWIREVPKGATEAAGYTTIHNMNKASDRLISGTAEFAEKVSIHQIITENGVAKMAEVAGGLELLGGKETQIQPKKGYHIMFEGLKAPLKAGESVYGTLTFEKAGTVKIEWKIEPLSAADPAEMGAMPGMDHSKMHMSN